MKRAERNWLLSPPCRCAVPPNIFPLMTRGALPLFLMEKASAPSSLRESSNGPLGRVRMEESPVRTAPAVSAATAEQKRNVVPEFSTSITFSGVWGRSPTPSMKRSSFFSSFPILAPKASLADTVARVSAESNGRRTLPPGPRAVIRIARWV